nr:transposase [Adonisia turfae]
MSPVHRRKLFKQWLAEHSDRSELFFLPTYSSELNPVEYLNNDVKQQVHDQAPTRDVYHLKRRVISSLRKLQKLPVRVSNYFRPLFDCRVNNRPERLESRYLRTN